MYSSKKRRVNKEKKYSLFCPQSPRKRTCDAKRLSLEWLEFRLAASSDPIISEFMAANAHTLADGNGEYPDWIEIHNPNTTSFDISGWYLTDNSTKPTKWQFPTGTILAAGEYRVVFCDDGLTTFPPGELHTTFKLDKEGEYLALNKPEAGGGVTIVQEFAPTFPLQYEDISYGIYDPSVKLSNIFNSDLNGFTYQDSVLTNNASEARIDGVWSSTGGYNGTGGLKITGTMSTTGRTVNGGFYKSVSIDAADTYNFSVAYRMVLTDGASNFRTTEYGQTHLMIKNAGGTVVLDQILRQQNGQGSGYASTDTGWLQANLNVSLAAGNYTVILALKNSPLTGSTLDDNTVVAYFDNLAIVGNTPSTTAIRYFTSPTPGAANSLGILGRIDDRVEFSQDHGFYTSPFDVTLSCAASDMTIRFTTDGSAPTFNTGTLYTVPIHVAATTVLRASAFKTGYQESEVETRSYIFLADVVTQSPTGAAPTGWPAAGWLSGISMSHFLSYGMDPDIVNNSTWGPQMIQALQSIPTMSLVTDVGNLFNPATGIIVNSNQSGSAWERAASLELVNPDGTPGFQTDVGIRIRGSAATTDSPTVKYGFRVYFEDEYGEGKLAYPLFGDEGADTFDKIDLRTTQNWSWSKDADTNATFLRDIFSRDTQRDMGEPYARGRVYHLYINGQYWGLYETDERPDADYAASYLGGSKDDYDVIKVTRDTTSGIEYSIDTTDGNLNAWQDLYNQMTNQYTVNYYLPTITVNSIADAESVISDSTLQTSAITAGASTINFINTGSDGHYAGSAAFPGTTLTTNTDNFVIETMGTISVSSSGNWTFGISTGESFSFELSNGVSTYSFTYTGTGTVADVLRTFNLSAGDYNLRIVYFDDAGGANLELFAAPGMYTTFNASAFDLIGDTASGGLALPGMASNVAYQRVQGLNPDGTANPHFDKLLDVNNLVDYMLTIFYTGNFDAPVSWWFGNQQPNNFFAVYNHTNPDGFKFIAHDSEHTLNAAVNYVGAAWNQSSNPAYNRLGPYPNSSSNFPDGFLDSNPQLFHQKLYQNAEYRLAFANRVKELTTGNGALTAAAALARYDARKTEYSLAVIPEAARWGDYVHEYDSNAAQCTPTNWTTAVAAERALIPGRTAILISELTAFSPTLYPETFSAGPSQWAAAGSAGLTLKLGTDGKIHLYITGTTTDAVTPHLPANIITINISGRENIDDVLTVDFAPGSPIPAGGIVYDGGTGGSGNSLIINGTSANDAILLIDDQLLVNASAPIKFSNVTLFGFYLAAGSDNLRIDHATLKINQNNAISAGTDVTFDAGILDLNGMSDTLGDVTLLSGGILNGTLYADSYNIESGAITAILAGPGALVKTTTGRADAGSVNTSSVTVNEGELTADSIFCGTLTVAAGGTVTINPLPGGPMATLAPSAITNAALITEPILDVTLAPSAITNAALATEPILDATLAPMAISNAALITEPILDAFLATTTLTNMEPESTTRLVETVADRCLPQTPIYLWFDTKASFPREIEEHFSKPFPDTHLIDLKDRLSTSQQDELSLPMGKVEKRPVAVINRSQKTHYAALQSIIYDSTGKNTHGQDEELDFDLSPGNQSLKQTKQFQKAVDAVLGADRL